MNQTLPPAPESRYHQAWILLLIFTASGFSGLIYQSIWSHYLGLYLGHAAYAQALVLAIFMGGMALGAWTVSKRSAQWRNLVKGYAIVEAIIGIIALIFHSIFTTSLDVFYEHIIPAINTPTLVYVWKWFSAALLILPQSILLGMTFPLLSGGYIRRTKNQDGQVLSGLYFTNSIGAAAGALASTFLLLPWSGLPGTVAIAGWINLAVAVIAWLVASKGQETIREAHQQQEVPEQDQLPVSARFILFAAFVTGASSFIYEIGWVRMLNLALGTTLHSFEIMLSAFIAGLAFGGLWIRKRIDHLIRPLRAAGFAQLLMGLAVVMSLALYNEIFDWVGSLYSSLSRDSQAYALYNTGSAAIAMIIMIPAAFFAGMTLPLFTLALLRGGIGEAAIGRVYATNTLGAIAGVFLAVHILIPWLGLKLAMLFAASADLLLGIALLRLYFRFPFRFDYPAAIAASVIAIFSTFVLIDFDYNRITSGVFRHGQTRLDENDNLLFYKDGKTASISVVGSNRGTIRIATNGKTDGEAHIVDGAPYTVDEPTMMLAAALPLAYVEKAEKAAVIGFGTGLSTHTLLSDPGLSQVDTIEIEEAIVAGAAAFGVRNQRAYTDQRSKIHIEDAKSFFSSQQQKYDIILSEPSNPWVSGVGALFSEEFYQFVPRFLNEDGILVQWIQLYEISDELVASMLKALLPNFEHVEAFLSNNGDMIMLARNGRSLDEPLRDIFSIPILRDELALIDFTRTQQFAFRHFADRRSLQAFASLFDIRPNSDYFPILSLNAPRTRFIGLSADLPRLLSRADLPIADMLELQKPIALDQEPEHVGYYLGDLRTEEARAIRAYLLNQNIAALNLLPPSAANTVQAMAKSGQDCLFLNDPRSSARFIEQMHVAAVGTIPFLPANVAADLWQAEHWLTCSQADAVAEGQEDTTIDVPKPTLDARTSAALQVFQAVAQRDPNAMQRAGEAYLATSIAQSPATQSMNEYAYTAAVLGAVKEGNTEALKALNEAYFGKVQLSRIGFFHHRLLNVYLQQNADSLAMAEQSRDQ